MGSQQQWVGVDWGTSNVRAWLMSGDGVGAASADSDAGMGSLKQSEYPSVLSALLTKLNVQLDAQLEIWICGMAGARQGWIEAPYLNVPTLLRDLGKGAVQPDNVPDHTSVRILPGLCQTGGHEDVMRGEETQLLGLLAQNPDFEGAVCMPGTHSKWVDLNKGTVTRFATAMTGEMFALLSKHSVLRHSLGGDTEAAASDDGISEGLADGLAHPERLSAQLFRTRAASLLSDKGADWCSGYLSGLLVGSEVAAHRSWIGSSPVALLGSDRLNRIYALALENLGAKNHAHDVSTATIAGLSAARENFNAD